MDDEVELLFFLVIFVVRVLGIDYLFRLFLHLLGQLLLVEDGGLCLLVLSFHVLHQLHLIKGILRVLRNLRGLIHFLSVGYLSLLLDSNGLLLRELNVVEIPKLKEVVAHAFDDVALETGSDVSPGHSRVFVFVDETLFAQLHVLEVINSGVRVVLSQEERVVDQPSRPFLGVQLVLHEHRVPRVRVIVVKLGLLKRILLHFEPPETKVNATHVNHFPVDDAHFLVMGPKVNEKTRVTNDLDVGVLLLEILLNVVGGVIESVFDLSVNDDVNLYSLPGQLGKHFVKPGLLVLLARPHEMDFGREEPIVDEDFSPGLDQVIVNVLKVVPPVSVDVKVDVAVVLDFAKTSESVQLGGSTQEVTLEERVEEVQEYSRVLNGKN